MLESVRTLLKITRLTCGKSYLVIIALIHMKHLVGSNIAQNHHLPSLVSFLASIQIKQEKLHNHMAQGYIYQLQIWNVQIIFAL